MRHCTTCWKALGFDFHWGEFFNDLVILTTLWPWDPASLWQKGVPGLCPFCLGVDNFVGSEDWINSFTNVYNIVCNTAVGESKSVYSETVYEWKNGQLLHDIKECDLCDIFNVYETGLSLNIQLSKGLTSCGGSSHGGTKSKQWVALLLACNADDNNEPLVNGKYRSPHCLNNVKKLKIKYVASRSSWITTMKLGEYLIQLYRKVDAKNKKPTFPWSLWCWLKEHNISVECKGSLFPI